MKKYLAYLLVASAVFGGAIVVSHVNVVGDAYADCTSTWATCSESDVNELERELDAAGG